MSFSSVITRLSSRNSLGFCARYRVILRRMKSQLPNGCTVVKGDFESLPFKVKSYVTEKAAICTPDHIHICDGSETEHQSLIDLLMNEGLAIKLKKRENSYLVRTDPRDVARVESKTFICTKTKSDAIPTAKEGVQGKLGNWMAEEEMEKLLGERFPGCMKGRTMYVMPFSMGPVGSPVAKIGIELTDSPYVVLCMRVMTRMGVHVMKVLGDGDFVKCMHSVGAPLPREDTTHKWPCNPEKTVISHFPDRREIISYGSGYGGNSLLGKKCFALRIAMRIARDDGWLAEHMLITGLTNPQGEKKYFVAAFPSACGKTNLAMMQPTLPGWKVECVGDDIAWMWFDKSGQLRAINPESGFFGVAPGTSNKTNPLAMEACEKDAIFTNTAETSDGDFWWEGLPPTPENVSITSWKGEKNWDPKSGTTAAHPNSRFTALASNCPIMDKDWENPEGVPISGILFGGRRPEGVPLVYEAFNWQHGVFIASGMTSESTAAAEHKGKQLMHDPFAMRPFFGYNFGKYLEHWLSFAEKPELKLPKIFHVNWFRKEDGKFLWPGFGENSRVLEWCFRRCNNEDLVETSPIGYLPKANSINTEGLEKIDMEKLLDIPREYWIDEVQRLRKYYDEQVGSDLPEAVNKELDDLEQRVKAI